MSELGHVDTSLKLTRSRKVSRSDRVVESSISKSIASNPGVTESDTCMSKKTLSDD